MKTLNLGGWLDVRVDVRQDGSVEICVPSIIVIDMTAQQAATLRDVLAERPKTVCGGAAQDCICPHCM